MRTTIRIIAATILLAIASETVWGKNTTNQPPQARQTELLLEVLHQYEEIKNQGGWPQIKPGRKFYLKDQKDPVIATIKQRLRTTGEFVEADSSTLFTEELASAIKKAQKKFGLTENGVVDPQLIKYLNVPVEDRIKQIHANLERFASLPPPGNGTRLVANIPEFKLHVYEGTEHVFEMKIVVGTVTNKSAIFNDTLTHIVFSPYWNVPASIVRSEILPEIKRSSTYLKRNGYEQVGIENGLPVIRQKPGPNNSLGLIKFIFPNEHHIYFHDTPAKSLFDLSKRTFSHGCIRLAAAKDLAVYLLRHSEWNEQKIEAAMNSGKEQWVNLNEPVAVSLTYFTAWVNEDGEINFREDIYGYDKKSGDIVKRNQ